MPEDLRIGFRFFANDNGDSIANDKAERAAMMHLENEIARFAAFDHLERAVQAVQTAAAHNTPSVDSWEDNVPPDLTDGFDFLL
ncbi:hypothetical protein [Primorskyibacter sp. 2E233]|uniref:hypothetical protein n=1 Tax=Primorskyibacter sp. 2E233 TaxID=3413431 RepID=UPI003BF302E2